MDNFYFQRSLNFSIIYFLFFSVLSGIFLFYYDIFLLKYYLFNVFIAFLLLLIFLLFIFEAFVKRNYIPLILILLAPLLVLIFKNKVIISIIYIFFLARFIKSFTKQNFDLQTLNKKTFFFIFLFTTFILINILVKNHSLPSDYLAIFNLNIHTDTATRLAAAEIFKNYFSISSGVGSIDFVFSSLYSEIFFGSIIWLLNLKSYDFFYWFHYGFFYSLVVFLFTFFIQIINNNKNSFNGSLSIIIFFILSFYIIKPETFSNLFGNSPYTFGISILLIMLTIIFQFIFGNLKSPGLTMLNLVILNVLIILSKTILTIFSLLLCSYYIYKTRYSTKLKISLLILFCFFSFLFAYLSIYQFLSNDGIALYSLSKIHFDLFTFLEILFLMIYLSFFFQISKLKKDSKYFSIKECNIVVFFLTFGLVFIFCLKIFNFIGSQYFWLKITSIIFFIPLLSIYYEISLKKLSKLKHINLIFTSMFLIILSLNLYTSKYTNIYNKIKFTHQSSSNLIKNKNPELIKFKNLIKEINILTYQNKSNFILNIPKSNYLFWDISSKRDCHLSSFIFQNLTGLAILDGNRRPKTAKCPKDLTPDFRIKTLNFSKKNYCEYLLRNTQINKIIFIDKKNLSIENIKKCI